jgi:hypothetical protein
VPRTRALLSDPARSEISATLMDTQVANEEAARLLLGQAKRLLHQSRAARRAQERLTAAELRAEREAWDGDNRRQFDRRSVA